jgi:hypothetical protein
MAYSSFIIDELSDQSRTAGNLEIGLAYVYCDYRDQAQQTTTNLIGGMLKQLLAASPTFPQEIITIYEQKCQRERKSLELSDALTMLRSTCRAFNRIYLCLDALDECRDVTLLLRSLQDMPFSVRIFMTSRKHVQKAVQSHFKDALTIQIEANESDIRLLVKSKIDENRIQEPDIMDEALEKEMLEKIVAFSMGMLVAPSSPSQSVFLTEH